MCMCVRVSGRAHMRPPIQECKRECEHKLSRGKSSKFFFLRTYKLYQEKQKSTERRIERTEKKNEKVLCHEGNRANDKQFMYVFICIVCVVNVTKNIMRN